VQEQQDKVLPVDQVQITGCCIVQAVVVVHQLLVETHLRVLLVRVVLARLVQ
jgi:hypothetical protein